MAAVFVQFAHPVIGEDGTAYLAQACGAPTADGMWEGWIEFVPLGGGEPVRSPRETTQPTRTDTAYWATGLTPMYLEGALHRALHPPVRRTAEPAQSLFDAPAPRRVSPRASAKPHARKAVLDPFSVYEKGEVLLRKELGALSPRHLVNIILAHGLSDEPETHLNRLPDDALIEIIVAGVGTHVETR
jgi:hypothetical protein